MILCVFKYETILKIMNIWFIMYGATSNIYFYSPLAFDNLILFFNLSTPISYHRYTVVGEEFSNEMNIHVVFALKCISYCFMYNCCR